MNFLYTILQIVLQWLGLKTKQEENYTQRTIPKLDEEIAKLRNGARAAADAGDKRMLDEALTRLSAARSNRESLLRATIHQGGKGR